MTSMGKLIVQGGFFTSPIYTNHTATISNGIAFPRIFNSSHSLHFSGKSSQPPSFRTMSVSPARDERFAGSNLSLNSLKPKFDVAWHVFPPMTPPIPKKPRDAMDAYALDDTDGDPQQITHLTPSGYTECKHYHVEAETEGRFDYKFKRSIRKGDTISLNDLLFTDKRDYLIKNNNQYVKAEQLKDKVIGVYFLPLTAKYPKDSTWHTTLLKDIYDDLHPVNNFEVVLVACNDLETDFEVVIPAHRSLQSDAQKLFQDLFSCMPWTAIPFSDVTSRKHIQRSFGVPENYIFRPQMYIIDQTGLVLQCSSWKIFDYYGALGYPFSDKRLKFLRTEDYLASQQPSLKTLLGSPQRDYVISNNGDKVPIHTFEDKVVALYFYQPDDPDSPTEELKLAYEEFAKKKKIFEVVLVYVREGNRILRSEESFWEEFKTMPWLALPFKDMSYKKLKRVFEFKSYNVHRLVIFGPRAEYIEPFGCSMLLKYGFGAFPFTCKNKLELEIKKLKELNLGTLWNPDNVFRRNDGSQVPFPLLSGKRVMLVLDGDALERIDDLSEKSITKPITMLKEKYFQTKGTDDEFEVIRILINDTESLFYKDLVGDMPWLVSPASDLIYDLGSSHFWYGICHFFLLNFALPILAFDQDGRLVRKTLHAEFEDMKFPFFSGVLEEETLSSLSSTWGRDDYDGEYFQYNGRIYR